MEEEAIVMEEEADIDTEGVEEEVVVPPPVTMRGQGRGRGRGRPYTIRVPGQRGRPPKGYHWKYPGWF